MFLLPPGALLDRGKKSADAHAAVNHEFGQVNPLYWFGYNFYKPYAVFSSLYDLRMKDKPCFISLVLF